MASDPLSVDSLLTHMADALPTRTKDQTDSDISSSYEAIALFCHACMVAVGFRLVGFGEGQKIGRLLQGLCRNSLLTLIHRIRAATNSAAVIYEMERLIWLALVSICSYTIVHAICCQG